MTIIELTKTNEKGDKVKYFTDSEYFNKSDLDNLYTVFDNASKFRTTLSLVAGLAAYHVFNFVPAAKNFIATKSSHRSAGSLVALGAVGLTYVMTSFGVMGSVSSEQKRIVSRNSHPGWYNRESVVNPTRVFFQLDDTRNNQISIIHSGLNVNSVGRLFPDFIVGDIPSKPHKPVAEHHH